VKFIENPGDAAVASFGLLAHIDEESRRELFSKGFGASAPAVEEAEKFVEFNLFTTRIRDCVAQADGAPLKAAESMGYEYNYFRRLCKKHGVPLRRLRRGEQDASNDVPAQKQKALEDFSEQHP